MPSSAILDVAIGIAFVYLFLSLLCSVVNEGIASILSLRAKNLVRGISNLFSESTLADGRQFVEAIYAHGLVRGLYQDPRKVDDTNPLGTNGAKTKTPQGQPAPAANQPGLPLVNLQHAVDNVVGALLAENLRFPSVLTLVKKVRVNLPAYIPSRTFSTALIDVIAPPDPTRARVLDDVREAIIKLPPSPTQQALLSLVSNTEKDITEFQDKVESWFNDAMDRASGWYKRRTQYILLAIGLAVTLALNVDTIKLAQTLWNNPVERQATVDLAQKYVEQNKSTLQTDQDLKTQADQLSRLGQQLPFPFGWQTWLKPKPGADWKSIIVFWGESATGWLITTLALSLGAPFWFDTLNKFMVVRSAVKPTEKSKDG